MYYRILLSFHLISIICWMAGILYLIRLFVYHAAETEAVVKDRFNIMQRRLYRYITFPAMISSFGFGIAMIASNPPLIFMTWLQVKLIMVVLLAICTLYSGRVVKEFESGSCLHTEKFFRFFNEGPTLLMIGIVFLAVLKTFWW